MNENHLVQKRIWKLFISENINKIRKNLICNTICPGIGYLIIYMYVQHGQCCHYNYYYGPAKVLLPQVPGEDLWFNECYVWWVVCPGTVQQLRETVLGVSIPQNPRGVEDRGYRNQKERHM